MHSTRNGPLFLDETALRILKIFFSPPLISLSSSSSRKANVDKAKQMILDIQKELVNVKEDVILIPFRFHNSIIGAKGKLIRSIMEDCGGVTISFPPEGSNSGEQSSEKT